jgi:hypothetical protein
MIAVGFIANPYLKLEHYIDCLMLESRLGDNPTHIQKAKEQLIDFIDTHYVYRFKETRENDTRPAG